MEISTPMYIIFAINVLTSIVKRWVYPRYGTLGTHVLVFILATIGAVYWMFKSHVPGLENIIASAIALFALSITFYEVILQYIPTFRGPALEE